MAVTGLVAPLELETRAQMLFERVYGGMGKGMQGRRYQPGASHRRSLSRFKLWSRTNMAYRREAFERVGTSIPPWMWERRRPAPATSTCSTGSSRRLILQYEPRALVWHQHRREIGELRQLFYNDGRSFAVYLRKLWRTRTVPRWTLPPLRGRSWGSWLIGRVLKGLLGRHGLPLPLLGPVERRGKWSPGLPGDISQ